MVLPLKITRPLSTPLYQALQRAGSQLVRSSRMENIPLEEVPMVKILGEARGTRSPENPENPENTESTENIENPESTETETENTKTETENIKTGRESIEVKTTKFS